MDCAADAGAGSHNDDGRRRSRDDANVNDAQIASAQEQQHQSTNLPLVVDIPYVMPAEPADDVLLSDLSWSTLEHAFPNKIHALVTEGESPRFAIVPTGLRTVGLLPVRTRVAGQTSQARWVPFLIDTGSHQTFFATPSIDALNLTIADNIEIFDRRVMFSESTSHFRDINLLGTDFLRNCELTVRYPAGVVELRVVPTLASAAVWVRQRNANGDAAGRAFRVSPAANEIDSLADAIKVKLGSDFTRNPALITIYAPGASAPAGANLELAETTALAPFLFQLP